MKQIINQDEVQTTSSKKPIIKIVNDIDQAQFEIQKITNRTSGTVQDKAIKVVNDILKNVDKKGDEALKEYTSRFDGFRTDEFQVPSDLIQKAWEETHSELKDSLLLAKKRIETSEKISQKRLLAYVY